jgi:hypothetical protein
VVPHILRPTDFIIVSRVVDPDSFGSGAGSGPRFFFWFVKFGQSGFGSKPNTDSNLEPDPNPDPD